MVATKRKAVSALGAEAQRGRELLAGKAGDAQESAVDVDEEADAGDEREMQIVAVEEPTPEQKERAIVEARVKELRGMYTSALKELVGSKGLETGKKEDMIKALLKLEAKERKAQREHEEKIRGIILKKKEELERMPASELSKQCEANGFKGLRAKHERVSALLRIWQQNDGVDNALAALASEERRLELTDMGNDALRKLCLKVGADPYVKEAMVDRISKLEHSAGRYLKPTLDDKKDTAAQPEKMVDTVEALLQNEAKRKEEKAQRAKEEEAMAKKMKELRSMTIDDVKADLAKRGLEASGKKEELLAALLQAMQRDEAIAAKKAELKNMAQKELSALLSSKGLEVAGSKGAMVEAVLRHEDKLRTDLRAYISKSEEVLAKRREELEDTSNAALKELCATKGLPVGGGKEDRIERLVEAARESGEADKAVSAMVRAARREELFSMDKAVLLKICDSTGADPFVTEVMVERIMDAEADLRERDDEPAAKKARKSKK